MLVINIKQDLPPEEKFFFFWLGKTSKKKTTKRRALVKKGGGCQKKIKLGTVDIKVTLGGGKNFFQDLFQINISQLLSSSCCILS